MSRIESNNLKQVESAWAKEQHEELLTSLVNSYEKYIRQLTGNKEYTFTLEQRAKLGTNLYNYAEQIE